MGLESQVELTGPKMEEAVKDLVRLMVDERNSDSVRCQTIQTLLDFTGSQDGREFLKQQPSIFKALSYIIQSNKSAACTASALKFFVNYTSVESFEFAQENIPDIQSLLISVMHPDSLYADLVSFILSNITRRKEGAEFLYKTLKNPVESKSDKIPTTNFENLVKCYSIENFNKKNQKIHYIGQTLANLAVIKDVRFEILKQNYFSKLASYITHKESSTRRHAAASLIRNCCLDNDCHDMILNLESSTDGECSDIVVQILLRLASGEDQNGDNAISEEDVDKFPLDLQYLDEQHKREEDPEIRRMLVQSLHLLSGDEKGREMMLKVNVYRLIDCLYQWECKHGQKEDSEVAEAELQFIELLIADKPLEEHKNLFKVQVPDQVVPT